MSNVRESVAKLMAYAEVTDKSAFKPIPSGYTQRSNAVILQLGLHPNKAVRKAVAENPLLRSMHVIAMYEQEQDAGIKKILEPRYQKAVSRKQDNKVLLSKIEDLERRLLAAEAK